MTAEETYSRSTEALELEVARVRDLLCRIYPYVDDGVGTEELQAELERAMFSELTPRRRVLRDLLPRCRFLLFLSLPVMRHQL